MNYFAIVTEMIRRAAAKRIELMPMPPERYYDPDTDERSADDPFTGQGCTYPDTPRGHYVAFPGDMVQIIAVEDYRVGSGVYDDLVPGYKLVQITQLPVLDNHGRPMPEHAHLNFTSIIYWLSGSMAEREWSIKWMPTSTEAA